MEEIETLVGLLGSNRSDVRKQASELVLSLTGTDGGIVMLHSASSFDAKNKNVVEILAKMLGDQEDVAENAAAALVNMTTNDRIRDEVTELKVFWSGILEVMSGLHRVPEDKPLSKLHGLCVKLLTNVTISPGAARRYLEGRLGKDHLGLDVKILINGFIKHAEEIPDAALVLTNVSRLDEGRDIVFDARYFAQLAPLIDSKDANLRRGVITMFRNCCFDEKKHRFLVRKTLVVDYLMKRLLGPEGLDAGEEYEELPKLIRDILDDEEETEKLQREPEDDIRIAIVDVFMMLASTPKGRKRLREKQLYQVIKVYHASETNEDTTETVFKLVDLLLGEEEEGDLESSDDESEMVEEEMASQKQQELNESPADNNNDGEDPQAKSILFEVD